MIDDTWRPEKTHTTGLKQEVKKTEVNGQPQEEEEKLQMPSITKLLNRKKLGLTRDLTKTIERPNLKSGTGKTKKGTQTGLRKAPEKSKPTLRLPDEKPPQSTPEASGLGNLSANSAVNTLDMSVAPAAFRNGGNALRPPSSPTPPAVAPAVPATAKAPLVPPPFVPKGVKPKEKSKIDLPPLSGMAPNAKPTQFGSNTPFKLGEAQREENRPQIQVIKPRSRTQPKTPLIVWNPSALQKSQDPFHMGVLFLIQNGAAQALLLCPQPSSKVLFEANSAYNAQSKESIWTGLTFDPAWMGDQAEKFLRQGFVELSPEREENSFLASTFGVEKNEWILLIRCGSPKACTGILILISHQSIKHQVKAAFTAKSQSQAA